MENYFTREELNLLVESLQYSKQNRENATTHPTSEFKKSQVEEVEQLLVKVRALKK